MSLNLKDRTLHEDGSVEYTEQGLIELLYAGGNLYADNLAFQSQEEQERFNEFAKYFKLQKISPVGIDHAKNQASWNMPEKYKEIDLNQFFSEKCETDLELERVAEELHLFEERDMMNLLRFLIYLVDFMDERKIVAGVGRGSSVASYCLFLVGIHKINSLKYEIPISEFLR